MNIFIQPYQHVYCFYNKAFIYLYDSYNNHFYELNIKEKNYQIKEGLILFENPSASLIAQIMNLKKKSAVFAACYKKGDKLFAVDSLTKIRENHSEFIDKQLQSPTLAKRNITEINFALDSAYDLFTLKKTSTKKNNNTFNSFCYFLTSNDFENLKSVKFICSEISVDILKQITKTLNTKYQINFIIPFNEYISKKNILDKYKHFNIRYSLICDDIYKRNLLPTDFFEEVTYIFIVEKETDIIFLKKSSFSSNIRLKIHPIYNENFLFLKTHIGYSEKDLFSIPLTIKQILRRELINELFWGQLFINYNGDIYSGYSSKIGNILNNSVDYRQLFAHNSSWLKTRKQFSCCNDCKYLGLCPPPSMIELASGKVFCSLKQQE